MRAVIATYITYTFREISWNHKERHGRMNQRTNKHARLYGSRLMTLSYCCAMFYRVLRCRSRVRWCVLPAGHLPRYGNLLLQTVKSSRFPYTVRLEHIVMLWRFHWWRLCFWDEWSLAVATSERLVMQGAYYSWCIFTWIVISTCIALATLVPKFSTISQQNWKTEP